jgi:virginiamycin B lyase
VLVSVSTSVRADETTPEAHVEATIPQSGNVMGAGFDSVWMMNLATNKLIRIHPDDNSVTEIPILGTVGPFANAGLALGEGAVWVPDHGRSIIYKIDPKANQVAKEIPGDLLGGGALGPRASDGIAVGEGAVWAITDNKELRRYSAEGGNQEAAVSLPSHSSGVIVAFGSVWITGTGNDELYRVDPTTNQIAATIDLHSNPRSLVAGEGSIWICNESDGTVQRIDGKSGELVATIEAGAVGQCAIAFGGGFVWVSTRDQPFVQIDPRTNSVRGKYKVEMQGEVITGAPIDRMGELDSTIRFGSGSLWLSGRTVRRIKPPQ